MKLRIDTSGTSFVCTRTPDPARPLTPANPKSTTRRVCRCGRALDSSGGEVIVVTVAGDPKLTVGQPVQVDGLVALPWSQAGRSGVAFRAEALRATGAPLAGVVAAPTAATAPSATAHPGKPTS